MKTNAQFYGNLGICNKEGEEISSPISPFCSFYKYSVFLNDFGDLIFIMQ